MYQVFKNKRLLLKETALAMSLANGQNTTDEALKTLVKESFQNIFEPGEEATTMLDHHIDTGSSTPISVQIIPLRKRGGPPTVRPTFGSSSGRHGNQRGRM
ncbi:hypothetical protein TNCV_1271871 [Trichonephila clavipes]|nr:hypothetical protein TNCV_1271871 [Trichonephila clavipes]